MAEQRRKQGIRPPWIWLSVEAVVGIVVIVVVYRIAYNFGRNNPSSVNHYRSWLILWIVFLGTAVVAYCGWAFVLAFPWIKGFVSERHGRSEQAAEFYRRAVSRYLSGTGPFTLRTTLRVVGILTLLQKYLLIEIDAERDLELIGNARSALVHVRKNIAWRRFLGPSGFQDLAELLDLLEAAVLVPDDAAAGRLGRLEKRLAKDDDEAFTRGLSLYQLGYYKEAAEFFDRAARDYEDSADPDMIGLRLFEAFAAWEAGDRAGCDRRLRGFRPADLDLRLWAIGMKGTMASAQGKPEKAVALLERVASHVRDTTADPNALAWMASVRATALRSLGRYADALTYARQAAEQLRKLGPLAAVDSQLEVALALKGLGRHDEALNVAAGAAAELDATRYELGHMGNRVTFARANEKARALALELATVSAPRLAAELLESARVQGLPTMRTNDGVAHATPPLPRRPPGKSRSRRRSATAAAPGNTALSVARTAAGMAPLTPPPRLRLFAAGSPDTDRLAQAPSSAGDVVLAQVAAAVAGSEWWWWGSWAAGGQLYWSLVGHDGTVEAGAIPLASVEPALSRLAAALPSRLEGESGGNVTRARAGALARPETGVALASELGEVLIPPTLKGLVRARAAGGRPLSLVVAPAPMLGQVPFGLLGTAKAGTHLAHGAVIRLGASAALLDMIRRREPRQFCPRVLCVLDPCGKKATDPSGGERPLSLLPDGGLDQMGVTGWSWLHEAAVLSRAGHLPELRGSGHLAEPATIDQLGKMLRTTDPGLLAYLGHVSNASDDVPASASLVLDDDSLSARNLLYDKEPRRWPMPSRVALIGCGSGGARAPEWLGLAPASLWAGAQIVAATSWDLIDEADTWKLADEVVSVLHRSADPAAEWREQFIRHLAEWKSQGGPSPLSWGAIQFIGLATGGHG
jgi:tetratricopeptide (TPR) repeat protein